MCFVFSKISLIYRMSNKNVLYNIIRIIESVCPFLLN